MPDYCSQSGLAVIVMQITLGPALLLSLRSTLSAILEAGAALIVLGSSRRESAELEVALVKDAVTIDRCLVARAQTQ